MVEQADEVIYQGSIADAVIYEGSIDDDPLGGPIIFVSPQVTALTGHDAEAFLRDPTLWSQLIHPEDLPAVREVTLAMLATRVTGAREYRVRHAPSGTYRWVADRVTPLVNRQGRVIGFQGMARDVSARKEREAERLEQTARAEALAHVSQELAASLDSDQALQLVAQRVTALVGDACYVLLASDDQVTLRLAALDHRSPEGAVALRRVLADTPFRVGEGIVGQVAQAGESLLMPEVPREDLHAKDDPSLFPFVDRFGVRSLLIAPLRTQGAVLGVLGLLRGQTGKPYTADDLTVRVQPNLDQ